MKSLVNSRTNLSKRRLISAFVLIGAGVFYGPKLVHASATEVPFTQQNFDALRTAGKPIILSVHADWCSTCKSQARISGEVLRDPKLLGVTYMRADFDKEKALLKSLKVNTQSTLIVFKGKDEIGRSIGDTRRDSITALFLKAV
jgi:thioredoxin 1